MSSGCVECTTKKPLSPNEFQVPDDGILRIDPPPVTPMLTIDSVDALEALDVAPNPFALDILHHPVSEEEDGNTVDNQDEEEDNFTDANQVEEEVGAEPAFQAPQTVTRSGRVSHGPIRFHDKTPQEHDDEARERQFVVQQACLETVQEDDDSSDEEELVEFVDAVEDPPVDPPVVDGADRNNVAAELAEFSLINIDVVNYEFGLVGASLGGGFDNTNELKPMKYKVAMAGPDKKHWEVAVEEEKVRFDKSGAVQAEMRSNLPPGTQVMDSTWACKKKSNGVFRARMNLRGFRQVDGVHSCCKHHHCPHCIGVDCYPSLVCFPS